ncbi:conserved unknown protein [Ectocarpus siliculosus]|uniref:Ubiquitin-like domain-containing protein n=1 Tax=Ectocarpus siliculosus TaxID=2880 RepID=D7G8X9_ECTSI|nr:conserved unknown protein [Ectocarpus siliculosus]|eukprot:CBJ28147.1 conserved unknown protein [Ectocarpus siliculosus]
MSMYIRLKRHNTTVFMHCEPADNFATIKAKAGKLMNIEQGQIGLFATRDKARELVDLATIGDQEIDNDQVLYVVKRSGDGYEDVSVTNTDGTTPAEGDVEK